MYVNHETLDIGVFGYAEFNEKLWQAEKWLEVCQNGVIVRRMTHILRQGMMMS